MTVVCPGALVCWLPRTHALAPPLQAAIVVLLAAICSHPTGSSKDGKDIHDRSKMVVYCSDQTHAIVEKA